jgi:DNA-directed RNA polymerase subunit RPC12/RpoP
VPAPVDTVSVSMKTIGTQTDQDIVCPHCGGNSLAKMDESPCCEDAQTSKRSKGRTGRSHRGRQWTREELLRLRDGAEKVAPASAPSVLFQSMPLPVPQA